MSITVFTIIAALAVAVLLLCTVGGWFLTLIGLPGNWLILLSAALFAAFVPDDWKVHMGWKWVVALLVLATLGEILEFFASAVGTKRVGGTRRAAVFALLGSVVGGIWGMVLGVPIPLIGSVVAALLFGGIGAAAGALFAEWSQGTNRHQTIRVGWGAFWGRLLGTGAKTLIGSAMVAVVVVALLV